MPTMLVEEPLGIWCVFSDGSRAEFSLDGLPNPRLARDLAAGLVELIHPHGSVDAAGSVDHYVRSLRMMVRTLAGQGFGGGAGDLRRGRLAQFWMAGPTHVEAMTRSLGEGILELAAGRHFNIQPNRQPLPPYPEAEWARLTGVCRRLANESYAAHRQALAWAEGRQPAGGGWTVKNFCRMLGRTGPVSTPEFARLTGVTVNVFRKRGGMAVLHDAIQAVFPHLDTLIAYRLLFGIYSGIVPDGIADLVVGDVDWAGDSTVLLSYVKGRTAAESLNLPRPAVRLLEQWLSHSALLRSFVAPPERGKLWLGISQAGNARLVREVDRVAVQR